MSVPASSPQFESGSFRGPDTRVFHHDGSVFRCLTEPALADWTCLAATDFYARFTEQGRLIPTTLVDARTHLPDLEVRWAAVLKHERVPMISYPYEWTFSMLRDAALLQLDLTLAALDEELHEEMCRLLERVHRETGVTILHITHSPSEARRLAGCHFRLADGKVARDENRSCA